MMGVIRGTADKPVYFLDGQEVTKKQFFAAFPEPVQDSGAGLIGWKPLHSDALAYHPEQRAEASEHLAKIGVPTEIDTEGRPILTCRDHRRRLLKALRMRDNDGGYGDG